MDDYYFESETTFDDEQRVEPGDERDVPLGPRAAGSSPTSTTSRF